ncbi:hypothetical protein KAR91_03120 [Candidatus Pacearchaeota archaeon]|nr:hypothetical protein [Candidatus Pacearchaeota archaeon]
MRLFSFDTDGKTKLDILSAADMTENRREAVRDYLVLSADGLSEFLDTLTDYLSFYYGSDCKEAIVDRVRESAKEQKKATGELYNHATSGANQAENLAQAIAKQAEIMASFMSGLQPEEIKEQSANLEKVMKVIASEGKTGFTVSDDGKITLKGGSGSRSANGDRANPLPPIEETDYIIKGAEANGFVALFKSDQFNEAGLKKSDKLIPGHWYASILDESKKRILWGSVGKIEGISAWSNLAQTCHNRVEGKDAKSVGISGLNILSETNFATIIGELGLTLK